MADELPKSAFDATDTAAENNVRREAARIQQADADYYRLIMHTVKGRAWLHRRLSECKIFGDTFAAEQTHVTAFSLGQENIGKRMMAAAQNASADLYVQMIKEHQVEEARLDEVRRTEENKRTADERPPNPEDMVVPLPPPAGYPGGPPLQKPANQPKR